MSEMIERAVKAALRELDEQHVSLTDQNSDPIYTALDPDKIICDGDLDVEKLIRVVIQEIRAPSDAMVDAAMNMGEIPWCNGQIIANWECMIDAALAPVTPKNK